MTENELTKKLKNKDNDAYFELVKLYEKKLYYFCLKILKNSFDATDAVQMTFIKISSSINSFEKRGNFSSWIYKIALNNCNDILRQKKRRQWVLFDNIADIKADFFPKKTPEEHLLSSELGKIMYSEIKKLPKNQKSLIILRDIHGFSYNEIERILSMKEGTVKSGLNRARKKLRENLEQYLK